MAKSVLLHRQLHDGDVCNVRYCVLTTAARKAKKHFFNADYSIGWRDWNDLVDRFDYAFGLLTTRIGNATLEHLG